MAKETKIGLAVIGVLVTIFSVLLVRHFRAGHLPPRGTETAQTPIEPLSSSGMSKADVTVASGESSITGSKLWDTPSETVVAEPMPGDLPPESAAAGGPVSDPYSEPAYEAVAAVATEPDPAAAGPAPLGRSPFDRGPAADAQPAAAAELPAAEKTARNPLRRTSANLPLDAAGQTGGEAASDDPGAAVMTLPAADGGSEPAFDAEAGQAGVNNVAAEPRDPFAATAPDSQATAALRDPFEAAPQAEPLAEPAPEAGAIGSPDYFEAAGDSTGQFGAAGNEQPEEEVPAEPSGPNAFDRQPAAAVVAQPATQMPADDWQVSPPVAQPQAAQPAAVQPVEPAPLPIENGKYTVQPGDTLWSISEGVYGTGGYFKALGEHNRQMLPRSDALTVGSQLSVPPRQDLERDFPSLCPKQRKSALVTPQSQAPARPSGGRDAYIVNEGDTLFDIARYELGKASRWAEIYDLNRDLLGEDFDYLRPGTELRMPPREVQNAAQPAARY